jgi:uncharacterized Zn ribbon protein
MGKRQKDMGWLLDDEDNTTIEVKDSNGNLLESGDTVAAIKDIKVK